MFSHAESFIDLGHGSCSLFDALLEQKIDLVYNVGVKIFIERSYSCYQVLHSKSCVDHKHPLATTSFKITFVYEGRIIEFDQQVHGFDVATCIEVIEHMEDQSYKFKECTLDTLSPCILMVSTPNMSTIPFFK